MFKKAARDMAVTFMCLNARKNLVGDSPVKSIAKDSNKFPAGLLFTFHI